MTAKEYLEKHSERKNGTLEIGPIDKDIHYCIQCFDNDGMLRKVELTEPDGWKCKKGHVAPRQRLATGGWA